MGDFYSQISFIPPSRNMARRGRFPSRINTVPLPNRYSLTTENGGLNKESMNVFISDSQNSYTDSQKETSESDMCVSSKSSTDHVKGGCNRSFKNSRNFQKTITKSKSPFLNNLSDSSPLQIKTNLKSLDFDKQLEYFLAETSKGRCPLPFPNDDVIPATPERPFQRLSSAIKLKAGSTVIKNTPNIVNNTEISFNGPIKKAGGETGSENVTQKSQTPINEEKCTILEKIETVSRSVKNLITTHQQEACNGNAEVNIEKKNCESPKKSQRKYTKPKTIANIEIEHSRDNAPELTNSTMVQEPDISSKRVLRKKASVVKVAPSRTVSSQKDTLVIKVSDNNDVNIIKTNKSKKAVKKTPAVKQNVKENKKSKNGGAGRNTTNMDKKEEPAANRRVLSRKGRGGNIQSGEYGEDLVSKTVSSTSVLSKISTRSQSAVSLEKNHNDKSFFDKNAIDEFFDKNCTKNNGNPTIDPRMIRKMNASSSDDSEAENDKAEPESLNYNQSSKTSNNVQHEDEASSKISLKKSQKQLRVTLCKSPEIDKLVENQQLVPEKINLKDYIEIDLKSPSRCDSGRKRKLYSGKFDNTFSESESPKKVKTPVKSLKRASDESAKIYINIENERKKAKTGGDGRAKGTTKQQKVANKKENIKQIHVPKNTQPCLNANFSYRRFSNENNDQNKNNVIYDRVSETKNVYSDFEDFSSDNEKFTSRRRKAAQKKPATTKTKQPNKSSAVAIFDKLLESENRLIDEKIRSVTFKQPSLDNNTNLFEVDIDNNLNVAPVQAEPLAMIHPDDGLDKLPVMTADTALVTCAEDSLPEPLVKDVKKKKVCVDSKPDIDENENAIKKSLSKIPKQKKITNKLKKMDLIQTEKEKCDMDVSLPPLVVEESCKKTNNDSLVRAELDNLKGAMKDITNTTNDISYLEEAENCAVVRSIHFEPLNSTTSCVGLSQAAQNKEENEDMFEQVKMQEPSCVTSQNSSNNDFDSQNDSSSENWNQLILGTPNDGDFNLARKGQSPSKISEIVMQANMESILQSDCSNNSDSEISVCSIIVSTRKSRGSQLSSNVTLNNIGEMFDNYSSGSDSCINSSIMSSKRMPDYPERSVFNANLHRISEESIQRSDHSTPKTGVSFNCSKYLNTHISPLRLPTSLKAKPESMECGDGSMLEHGSSSKKKVLVPAKRVAHSTTKLGGRGKGSSHSMSRASTHSSLSTEQSVKSTPSKRNISRCGTSFFIPKSESEKKYTELGCSIRTTLDVWCTQLSTMEQHLDRFKREIDTFKKGLFNDCCVRHRKNE